MLHVHTWPWVDTQPHQSCLPPFMQVLAELAECSQTGGSQSYCAQAAAAHQNCVNVSAFPCFV